MDDIIENALSRALDEIRVASQRSLKDTSLVEIDNLITHLTALKGSIERKLSQLAKQRNSLVPINSLPAELIIDILKESLPPWNRIARDEAIRTLCTVQSQWWHQITSCAFFWTDLSAEDSAQWTRVKLVRSQHAVLDIDCGENLPEDQLEKFFPVVLPEVNRWKCLKFVGNEVQQKFGSYFEEPLPALEELSLEEYGDGTSVRLVGGPRLRKVYFRYLVPKGWGAFRNLTSFDIGEIEVGPGFRVALLRVLAACPTLERLGLEQIVKVGEAEMESSLPAPIHLAHLTSLSLEVLPLSTTLLMQRVIRAEALTEIHVGHDDDEGGEQIFALLVQPREYGPSRMSQLFATAGVRFARLMIQDPNFYLEAAGEDTGITITISVNVPAPFFRELGPLFPLAGTTYEGDLELTWRSPYTPAEDSLTVTEVLNMFPNVEHFKVEGDAQSGIAAFLHLSQREGNEWHCKKLENISLSEEFTSSAVNEEIWDRARTYLARMVERRSTSGVLPAITVYGPDRTTIEDLGNYEPPPSDPSDI